VRKASAVVVLLSSSLFLTGCEMFWQWRQVDYKKTGASDLYPFESAAEMKQYLADQVKARSTPTTGGWAGLFGFLPLAGAAAPMADMSGQALAGDGRGDYSTTNIQVQGVDESDVMKNDANYVYGLGGGRLYIAKVVPPDAMEQLAQLDLDGDPDSLYLRGDRLVALSRNYGGYGTGVGDGGVMAAVVPENFVSYGTVVTLVDAADRSAPKVVKTYRFEGDLVSSRMIEDRLHLILAFYPVLPAPAEIPATPLDDILPKYVITGDDGTAAGPSPIAGWQDFYRPADPDGYGMVTVATIDTADPNAEIASVGLTADAGTIYASTKALYLTDTEWGYGPNVTEQTIIHKFTFTESGAEYAASGAVPGRPLNQFSLGEHEDYLRIATTLGRVSRTGTSSVSNNVFVLGQGESGLVVVGEVRDIAPGEQIYSARFLGTRGFLVTFEKVDPLFTLDLSDPNEPNVVGKLKVPGYSDYIHIMDANHLLTIGKDAEDVGDFSWYQGVQLSVFDVTDFANPQQLHKQIIGGRGTESEALHDHRAFNYFAPRNLLAIPIILYEGGSGGPTMGQHTFTGLYVYRVTVENGIELLGRIPTTDVQPGMVGWYYDSGWSRGVFIGEHVYAVTADQIRSAALADVNTILDTVTVSQ